MINFKQFVEARETKAQKAQRKKAEKAKEGIQTKSKKKNKGPQKPSKKVNQPACQLPGIDDSKKLDYSGTEYLFKYRGRWFIDTEHSVKRRFQEDRAGSLTDNEVMETLKKVGDKICGRLGYFSTKNEAVMFYYRKYGQGVVIVFDEDYKFNHGKNSNILDWVIKTWLTRYDQSSSATKKVFFSESIGKYIVEDKGETYEIDKIVNI